MKPILRILVILLSIAIVVIALWPSSRQSEEPPTDVPPTETAGTAEATALPQSQKMIRDLLGGAAIDSGNKAKEKISDLNKQREQEFEESGL